MNDDQTAPAPDDDIDAPTDGGAFDDHDDAVFAADDTGMLAGERLITVTEIEDGLSDK